MYTPPRESLAATSTAPIRCRVSAATEPTLPNPWTATRAPSSGIPSVFAASRAAKAQPNPVASSRPKEPPTDTSFPVTTAGTE